jgi:hypothetical protein
MELEWTFGFSVWMAVVLISLILICGCVTAIVFRRITSRYEKKIEQLQHRSG